MDDAREVSPTVECLGLPGVGKTRLCAALGTALAHTGTPIELCLRQRANPGARLRNAGRVLSLVARRPGYCRRSLRLIVAAEPEERWWLARTWLKRSASARRATPPTVRLTDAGIAQALWSLALRARCEGIEEILTVLAAEAPLADLVLVLEADHDLLVRRLARRSVARSRLERLLATDPSILELGQRLVELLAATLGDPRGGHLRIRVLRFRNDDEDDLERNVNAVVGLLTGHGPPLVHSPTSTHPDPAS